MSQPWVCPQCFETDRHTERCDLKHRTTPPAAPTVHLNGTGFKDLYEQMEEATHAIQDAMDRLCGAAPNGRDYYVQAPGAINTAMDEHYARIAKLRSVKAELEDIWMKISDQEPNT